MKVRMGFVSNSSSSSYLVLAPKLLFETMLRELSAFQQAVVKLVSKEQKVFGQDMVLSEWTNGNDNTFDYIDTTPLQAFEESKSDEYDDSTYNATTKFVQIARKAGAFIHTTEY